MSLKLLPLREKLWASAAHCEFSDPHTDMEESAAIFRAFCESVDIPEEVDVHLMHAPIEAVTLGTDGAYRSGNPQEAEPAEDPKVESYVVAGDKWERISAGPDAYRYVVMASTQASIISPEITSPVNISRTIAKDFQNELEAELHTLKQAVPEARLLLCMYRPPLLTRRVDYPMDRWCRWRGAKLVWQPNNIVYPLPVHSDRVLLRSQTGTYTKVQERVRQVRGSSLAEVVATQVIGRFRKVNSNEQPTFLVFDEQDKDFVGVVPI